MRLEAEGERAGDRLRELERKPRRAAARPRPVAAPDAEIARGKAGIGAFPPAHGDRDRRQRSAIGRAPGRDNPRQLRLRRMARPRRAAALARGVQRREKRRRRRPAAGVFAAIGRRGRRRQIPRAGAVHDDAARIRQRPQRRGRKPRGGIHRHAIDAAVAVAVLRKPKGVKVAPVARAAAPRPVQLIGRARRPLPPLMRRIRRAPRRVCDRYAICKRRPRPAEKAPPPKARTLRPGRRRQRAKCRLRAPRSSAVAAPPGCIRRRKLWNRCCL